MHTFHLISQHLVFESDVDGDGHLTKEEILEKYDLFVGSQVSFAQCQTEPSLELYLSGHRLWGGTITP